MPAAILDKIVKYKKQEIERKRSKQPLDALKDKIAYRKSPLNFAGAIRGKRIRLIAEVKKASPSRGLLCPNFKPLELASTYEQNGAAAISVLTESKYFMGDIKHLEKIKKEASIPLLRKDFIFDEYQIYESAAYGADALLLITAILSQEQLEGLISLSHMLGMQCLVEVHNEKELERALLCDAEVIGINNRDLNTFNVNTDTTRLLCGGIPSDRAVVSESGIKNKSDITKFRKWGVNAILVGESLVTAEDIPAKIKELLR